LVFNTGYNKYSTLREDPRVARIIGDSSLRLELFSAAYADDTWNKICSALNTFEKFTRDCNVSISWPLSKEVISNFIHWCSLEKNLAASTITSYMSHLKLIHNLRGLDASNCEDFVCRTQIRGAKNLQFYSEQNSNAKKVMTLPLLKILGHSIAISDWSVHSKSVIWCGFTIAFFGSFRFGELLCKSENSFNKFETLLWSDVRIFEDGSVQIHNKIPKSRSQNGEFVSLFEFPYENCCPLMALQCLKNLSNAKLSDETPIFTFSNGIFLTMSRMNNLIVHFLKPFIGAQAHFYSCKSFRAALPSALASHPRLENDVYIKRWGRWNSQAFERYTRLDHNAKKVLFKKFSEALLS
jgi:hypothetical protein